MGMNIDLLQQFIIVFNKKFAATHANPSGGTIKKEIMSNQQLAEAIHKPIARKILKIEVYNLLLKITFGC